MNEKGKLQALIDMLNRACAEIITAYRLIKKKDEKINSFISSKNYTVYEKLIGKK